VPLMADANAGYAPGDVDHLAGLDDLGLLMLEQPLEAGDLLRHADLQHRLDTPLCLDESLTSPERVEDMLRLDAGRIVNLKPGRVGGFGPSLRIHDLCRDRGVPLWCGGMLESGVGRGHNVALASLPGFVLPGDLSASRRYWDEDVVAPEWEVDAESRVTVPSDRPGIGVEVRRDRVEALTARREALTSG
ncbi:MAG: enolase C-terminal domain-like protein, partial [Acidimicrobiia bacterium]|nr:enolase C-terminal domain-like protein [Acidimicrobiia bacterium]